MIAGLGELDFCRVWPRPRVSHLKLRSGKRRGADEHVFSPFSDAKHASIPCEVDPRKERLELDERIVPLRIVRCDTR